MNSFIADAPHEEYQMDLLFFADEPGAVKKALLMVDIFSKYTQICPVKTKQIPDVLIAIKECLVKMKGKPKTIYSDIEGAFVSTQIQTYFKDEGIRHLTTLGHAPVAERQIRTMKDMIYKRIEHTKQNWWEVLFPVLLTYNNKMVHSVTKLSGTDNSDTFRLRRHLPVKEMLRSTRASKNR